MKTYISLLFVAITSACTIVDTIDFRQPTAFAQTDTEPATKSELNIGHTRSISLKVNSSLDENCEFRFGQVSLCNLYTLASPEVLSEESFDETLTASFPSPQIQPAWKPSEEDGCYIKMQLKVLYHHDGSSFVIVGQTIGVINPSLDDIDYTDVYIPCPLYLVERDKTINIALGETPVYDRKGNNLIEEITFDVSVEDWRKSDL